MLNSILMCPHKKLCSGCSPSPGLDQLIARATHFFSGCGQKDYEVVRGSEVGWRGRVKLAVRRQVGDQLAIGLFRNNSHEVVPIPHCCAHHPSINNALSRLMRIPGHLGYEERSATGQLRYVQAVVERHTGRVQLTFVLALASFDMPSSKQWEAFCHDLVRESPELWHSCWLNLQPLPVNAIFGPQWRRVVGEECVWETICGCQLPFLPSHFCQANLEMYEALLYQLQERISSHSRVVELFAGMGAISVVIASRCASVTAVERDASAEAAFLLAKSRLAPDLQNTIHYVVEEADKAIDVLNGATTVIVDPPRKGLTPELICAICAEKSVQQVLYISCFYPSLERDLLEFMRSGGFSLSFARSYLFFPGTSHLETLVELRRKSLGERI